MLRGALELKWIDGRVKDDFLGNSLAVQWLGLCAFTAKDLGLLPGWGTKIPQAEWWCSQKKKKDGFLVEVTTVKLLR